MNDTEKKILIFLLNDCGVNESLLQDFSVVSREFDEYGFYTTLTIPAPIKEKVEKMGHWNKVSGKTNNGILVGFNLYHYNGYLVIEGFSYDEPYPKSDSNYGVFLS